MSSEPTAYDRVAYRGFAYMDTHPRRLATLASLYGMKPASVSRCRVLELGCGNGSNLIPIAYQCPESEFIGIDLSAQAIAHGQDDIAALGLTNIVLRHADIADVAGDYGTFDYIIAHGVYSWVPGAIREKVLTIFHDNLTPQGVAFVSYNAHPGGHLRNLARDVMLFHVRGISDPKQRVEEARAILKIVSDASDANTAHGAVLRDQYESVKFRSDDAVFHDDLQENSAAFLLHRVLDDAERHGLQYVCDAALWRRWFLGLPRTQQDMTDDARSWFYLLRDQHLDFVDGHGFRQTLLCHRDVHLNRRVEPEQIRGFHLASPITPAAGVDPAAGSIVEFKSPVGTWQVDHALTQAALLELGRRWPAAIGFEELLANARRGLAVRTDAPDGRSDVQTEAMTRMLFHAACVGHIEFYKEPPPLDVAVSERPEASRVARLQASTGPLVTSLRHDMVTLKNKLVRHALQLADGTRTVDRLLADLEAAVAQAQPDLGGEAVSREWIQQNLQGLASRALLVR